MSDQRIKVIGTKGRYEADQKNRGIMLVSDGRAIEEINPDFCQRYLSLDGGQEWKGYGIESVQQIVFDVLNFKAGKMSLNDLNRLRPSFSQSMIPTAITEAATQSLASNSAWISISPIDLGNFISKEWIETSNSEQASLI